jgi:membrane-associated phospholipid phosphatase
VLTNAAKFAFGRERPGAAGETDAFEPMSFGATDNSFPSGHTSQAFALAAALAAHTHNRLLRVAAYGGAAMVGVARVAADRHFASDVVAGAILGTLVGHAITHHFGRRR